MLHVDRVDFTMLWPTRFQHDNSDRVWRQTWDGITLFFFLDGCVVIQCESHRKACTSRTVGHLCQLAAATPFVKPRHVLKLRVTLWISESIHHVALFNESHRVSYSVSSDYVQTNKQKNWFRISAKTSHLEFGIFTRVSQTNVSIPPLNCSQRWPLMSE